MDARDEGQQSDLASPYVEITTRSEFSQTVSQFTAPLARGRYRRQTEKTYAHLYRGYRNLVWSDRNLGGLGAVRSVSFGKEPPGARPYGQGPNGRVKLGSLRSALCSDCGRKHACHDDEIRRCFVCQCIAELTRRPLSTVGQLPRHGGSRARFTLANDSVSSDRALGSAAEQGSV